MVAHTDHTIQRHYNNYNHPELVAKVQLAHLRILHYYNAIELYELWLKKIEELFGAQNPELYIGASSDVVYRDQYARISQVLKSNHVEISKKPFWEDALRISG